MYIPPKGGARRSDPTLPINHPALHECLRRLKRAIHALSQKSMAFSAGIDESKVLNWIKNPLRIKGAGIWKDNVCLIV
jgi:hypothetical protein